MALSVTRFYIYDFDARSDLSYDGPPDGFDGARNDVLLGCCLGRGIFVWLIFV